MGFNFNNFLNKVSTTLSSVGNTITNNVKEYTPEKWSDQKKYINAQAAGMALMVYADGIVEQEEVEVVIETINNEPIFKEYNMVSEALELYSHHIKSLTEAKAISKSEYALTVAKISADISKVKKEEWKQSIVELSQKIAASDGDIAEDELKMLNKIKISLNL
jgi:tellurite resistance protein